MDLRERLEDYEVTSLPRRPPLRLAWAPAASDADEEIVVLDPPPAPLAILGAYRITRVPALAG